MTEGREIEKMPLAAGTQSQMKARVGNRVAGGGIEEERFSTGAVPDGA